jgi:hypothetical protein
LAKQSCLVDYETGAKKGIFHTRVEGDAVLIEAVQRCEQPAKNGIFEPFVYKNDPFAKTGSGQTQGKLKKDAVFRTGLLRRKVRRSRSQATRRAHAATLGDRGRGKIERLSRYAKHTNASHFESFLISFESSLLYSPTACHRRIILAGVHKPVHESSLLVREPAISCTAAVKCTEGDNTRMQK